MLRLWFYEFVDWKLNRKNHKFLKYKNIRNIKTWGGGACTKLKWKMKQTKQTQNQTTGILPNISKCPNTSQSHGVVRYKSELNLYSPVI